MVPKAHRVKRVILDPQVPKDSLALQDQQVQQEQMVMMAPLLDSPAALARWSCSMAATGYVLLA